MLTEQEIAEIKARCEAATLGEWRTPPSFSGVTTQEYGDICLAVGERNRIANMRFICYAREDIPALLADRAELVAEVKQRERLESARDIWKRRAQALERQVESVKNQREEIGRLQAENEALKRALIAKSTNPCSTCKKKPDEGYCYDINDCIRGGQDNRRLWEFDIGRFKDGGGVG